ncbi:IS982 family transposase [Enterococcus faecium]|uniref:IS982 family transposase n=1 Tax=Enterococcus faecium TaxID=1352 RepID=UPI001C44D49E|nr:IS982 family transposase [Enterococcus faecium]QXJ55198.1 IS982 family transposase [Enterococcus faecium]
MRTVSNIYHNCVPDKIKNRRNTDQLKQRDTVIIACVIWGIINGYTSQRATYRAVCSVLFPNGDFPSRSRFTRLSSNLAYTIKIIRYFFIKKLTKGELVGIIDSFPSPLCKPVRNRQAKLLNQIAKVGYNSTKKSYFYGLKIHMIVTKTGFPITYSITNPGVHDVKVLETLEKLGCQNFNSRSVKGLESRFESILLAYSVLLSRAQRRFGGTLRYSLGLLFVKLSETKLSIYVTQKNF